MTYEYISISWAGSSPSGKTGIYTVAANSTGDVLGQVRWHGPWHQYTFWPNEETIYSKGCLRDIATFMDFRDEQKRASAR